MRFFLQNFKYCTSPLQCFYFQGFVWGFCIKKTHTQLQEKNILDPGLVKIHSGFIRYPSNVGSHFHVNWIVESQFTQWQNSEMTGDTNLVELVIPFNHQGSTTVSLKWVQNKSLKKISNHELTLNNTECLKIIVWASVLQAKLKH